MAVLIETTVFEDACLEDFPTTDALIAEIQRRSKLAPVAYADKVFAPAVEALGEVQAFAYADKDTHGWETSETALKALATTWGWYYGIYADDLYAEEPF